MDCKVTSFMHDLNSLKVENLTKWFNDESKIWIPPMKEIQGEGRILALFRAIFKRYENIEWKASEIFDLGNNKFFYETISLSLLRSFVSHCGASTTNVDFRRGNPTRNRLNQSIKQT